LPFTAIITSTQVNHYVYGCRFERLAKTLKVIQWRKDKREKAREKNQKTGKDRAISQNLAKTGVGPAAMYSILTGDGAATTTVVGAGAEIGAGKSDASNLHCTPLVLLTTALIGN
jgi:hypothetical protein